MTLEPKPMMHSRRWRRCTAVMFALFVVAVFTPAALGRGGAQPQPRGLLDPKKLQPWEREVERGRSEQDRLINSCRARKAGLGSVLRRFKQRVIKEATAVNYYLYGRVLFFDKKDEEAIRMMRRALEVGAHFWYADWALAVGFLRKKRYQDVAFHLAEVRRKKPDHPQVDPLAIQMHIDQKQWREADSIARRMLQADPHDWQVRRILAICRMQLKYWEHALPHLKALLRKFPRDLGVRRGLIDSLLALERWQEVAAELRQFNRLVKNDPLTLWQLGLSTFQVGSNIMNEAFKTQDAEKVKAAQAKAQTWFGEAAEALVALDKLKPNTLHVLDLLQTIYTFLGEREKLVATLKRMLPLIEDPEKKQQLQDMLKRVEEGGTPGESPGDAPGWKRNPLAELLERCVHPDPAVRKQALSEYHDHDLPFVDPIIYRRYDPKVEPDAECRLLVVRILGTYRTGEADPEVVRSVSRYVALALEDPVLQVRTVAAEELGNIGAKTGILYVIPQFTSLRLSPLPADPDARSALVAEYNACRLALVALTGRNDVAISARNWILADGMEKNRDGWTTWLDGPAGVATRLAALKELRAIDDVDPRWHLRYILVDVLRPEPAPSGIALESYRVLRDRVQAFGDKVAADPWWKSFPVIPDSEVTGDKLPQIRERMKTWWANLPRPEKRPAAKQNAGAQPGGGPK